MLLSDLNVVNCKDLVLIDYGMSTRFIDSLSGEHIKEEAEEYFNGHPVFASRRSMNYKSKNFLPNNVYLGQSRADDLESWFFMLVYMHLRRLPWMRKTSETQFAEIRRIKTRISANNLWRHLPSNLYMCLSPVEYL